MPQLDIDGVRVEIEDGFLDLSPEEQAAEVAAIEEQLMAEGVLTPPAPGVVGAATQFTSGMNEGLADVLGAPVDLMTAGLNVIGRGTGLGEIEEPFAGSEWFQERMADTGVVQPPVEDAKTLRNVGRFTGGGLAAATGIGAAGTAARAGSALNQMGAAIRANPGKTAAAELASGVGAEAGGQAAEEVGLPRFLGELAGGIAAPMSVPAAKVGANKIARKALARTKGEGASTDEVLDAADRIGVDPSLGLVGNLQVARAENASGYLPLIGMPAVRKQQTQNEQLEAAYERVKGATTGSMRDGDPPAEPYEVGRQLKVLADEALLNLTGRLDNLEKDLSAKARDVSVDVRPVLDRLKQLATDTDPTTAAALQREADNLAKMRTAPIDPQLDAQLRKQEKTLGDQIRKLDRQIQGADPRAARSMRKRRSQLGKNLAGVRRKIDRNLGANWQALRDWRGRVGQRLSGEGAAVGKDKQLYAATTRAQEGAAWRGGFLDEFKEAQNEQRKARNKNQSRDVGRDLRTLEDIQKMDPQVVYNTILGGSVRDVDRLETIVRNADTSLDGNAQWDRVREGVLSRMGQQNPGLQNAAGDEWSATKFLTDWQKLSEKARDMLIPDKDSREELDAVLTIAEAIKRRARVGNPSGTTSTMATLGTAGYIGGGIVTDPVTTIGGAGSLMYAIKFLVSNAVARSLGKSRQSMLQMFAQPVAREIPTGTSASPPSGDAGDREREAREEPAD